MFLKLTNQKLRNSYWVEPGKLNALHGTSTKTCWLYWIKLSAFSMSYHSQALLGKHGRATMAPVGPLVVHTCGWFLKWGSELQCTDYKGCSLTLHIASVQKPVIQNCGEAGSRNLQGAQGVSSPVECHIPHSRLSGVQQSIFNPDATIKRGR